MPKILAPNLNDKYKKCPFCFNILIYNPTQYSCNHCIVNTTSRYAIYYYDNSITMIAIMLTANNEWYDLIFYNHNHHYDNNVRIYPFKDLKDPIFVYLIPKFDINNIDILDTANCIFKKFIKYKTII